MDDLILLDSSRHELGRTYAVTDFEIGIGSAANDFEMKLYSDEVDSGGVYIPNTEFGGLIQKITIYSGEITTLAEGYTWRGLLNKAIIEPPEGEVSYIASGDANEILRDTLGNLFGGLFVIPEEPSGVTITDYEFPSYCTLLQGWIGMLDEYNYRLDIRAAKPSPGEPVFVIVQAVPVTTLNAPFNEDNRLSMTLVQNGMGINHLIVLGAGEEPDREIMDLYMDGDGNVTNVPYYTGVYERTAVYDAGSASGEELFDKGEEQIYELCNTKELKITDANVDLYVGDRIMASYTATDPRYADWNMTMIASVNKIVLKTEGGSHSIEYSVEEI